VSWPHDGTVTFDEALGLLQTLKVRLSRSLDPRLQEKPPEAMQVWFEPRPPVNPASNTVGLPLPILALVGDLTVTPQTLGWATRHTPEELERTVSLGGRVLVRIHCGYLIDNRGRPFSASVDALTGVESLTLPGGVFESWFLIR
jgi:hypothetical protein